MVFFFLTKTTYTVQKNDKNKQTILFSYKKKKNVETILQFCRILWRISRINKIKKVVPNRFFFISNYFYGESERKFNAKNKR